MIKKITLYIALISFFLGGFVLPVFAKEKVASNKIKKPTCMQVATTKKNTAIRAAQKTYVMALKKIKGKEGKAKKTQAQETLKQDQKKAKDVFTTDSKACLSREVVVPPISESPREPIVMELPAPQVLTFQEKSVTYSDTGYLPAVLKIQIGETVVFKNQSTRKMWTASGIHPLHREYPTTGGCIGNTFDACKGAQSGESWSFRFDIAGTWKYHNHLNPGDSGTVIVE